MAYRPLGTILATQLDPVDSSSFARWIKDRNTILPSMAPQDVYKMEDDLNDAIANPLSFFRHDTVSYDVVKIVSDFIKSLKRYETALGGPKEVISKRLPGLIVEHLDSIVTSITNIINRLETIIGYES